MGFSDDPPSMKYYLTLRVGTKQCTERQIVVACDTMKELQNGGRPPKTGWKIILFHSSLGKVGYV